MTEYKWQTFKDLSLPSSIPFLLLNTTFHFFLITHSSVLNYFHTFSSQYSFLTCFFFLRILLLLPLHLLLPLLFHLFSLLSFYIFSSSPLTFFLLTFGLFFYILPPFAVTIPLFLFLHIFSLCPLPLSFFLFHMYSLSFFFISFPLWTILYSRSETANFIRRTVLYLFPPTLFPTNLLPQQ